MKKVHILYKQFFDAKGERKLIGGLETYLNNLGQVLKRNGWQPVIYQIGDTPFYKRFDEFEVIGVKPNTSKSVFRVLVEYAEKNGDVDRDILIFAADIEIVKTKYKKVLAIQHGIGWDIHPADLTYYKSVKYFVRNILTAIDRAYRYKKCTKVVCVDYNFLNWYRTMLPCGQEKLKVIPNFTEVPPLCIKEENAEVSIIFARRFHEYRGTRIFADAIEQMIQDGCNLSVCIAGEGPDDQWLQQRMGQYSQVKFSKFLPQDSLEVHQKFDIAVVPSLGSEGTSLSLLEAMAAGCAVICTNVGGLTNIVMDGYNGLMIDAEEECLLNALRQLYADKLLRNNLAQKGYETVQNAFSHEKWEKEWMKVINSM